MPARLDHTIFNERAESQDKIIHLLEKMGYEYVSRSDAEKKRGALAKVIFEDELAKYLRKQVYTSMNNNIPFPQNPLQKQSKK